MRVTIAALGFELDVTFGPTAAAVDDPAAAMNGGTTASTPMGFVAQWPAPEDIPLPQRTPPWDDEE